MAGLDYVVVGHITRDLVKEGFKPGGTATYAALTAKRLGRKVGVVTSASSALQIDKLLAGVALVRRDSAVDTTFENVYYPEGRVQFVRAVAEPIEPADAPQEWLDARILHLGPVAGEVDFSFLEKARSNIVGVTPQGWLRDWDETGKVRYRRPQLPTELMARISAMVISEEDIAEDPDFIPDCLDRVAVLVVTQGSRGARVRAAGQWRHFPAFQAEAVDPTGAGDVFAAAYLISLDELGDPFAAAKFANCAASFVVEKRGVQGIPTRTQIRQRMTREGR